jgi:hypothetical protein
MRLCAMSSLRKVAEASVSADVGSATNSLCDKSTLSSTVA